jgi:hypothetical protein
MATEFAAIMSSQLKDTQGETLDIAGADISELEAGRGYINDGHSNKIPDILGRITYAKKIMKLEDCEDDIQRRMWNKVKAPYLFGKGILFDDKGDHRSARAAAAILKHQHADDSPMKMKCSVEGGILERGKHDERELRRTKIKGLALTFQPANIATLIEGLNLQKSAMSAADQQLIKSCIPLIRTNVPSFIEVADTLSESKIISNIKRINELTKALTTGYGGAGSPTSLTGGGVLQTESLDPGPQITCSDCGKPQHYFKHQVKCRSCSKSFKFDTLADHFLKKNK